MASKTGVHKKESKGDSKSSSSSHGAGKKTTADHFGIWSTVIRVVLAFLIILILIFIIVELIRCMIGKDSCNFLVWLLSILAIISLLYGLWGIYAEAFWSVAGLAVELFFWSIFVMILGFFVDGFFGLVTCFLACIYCYMIYKSDLPLNGAAGCCCCICFC